MTQTLRFSLISVLLCIFLIGCASQAPPPNQTGNQSGNETNVSEIDSFEECAAAGYPIMESYPRQCRGPDGRTFVSSEDMAAINQSVRQNVSCKCRLRQQCCEECKAAYSQSPVAAGPNGAQCGHFISGKPISDECGIYFESFPSTVSGCG
ncbi:hypothetical protein L0Y65_03325 [Candidatus Micrarchaeota archaeon]|nr:hypothetical protein [Candidatus Micrarchaeota archaeon]